MEFKKSNLASCFVGLYLAVNDIQSCCLYLSYTPYNVPLSNWTSKCSIRWNNFFGPLVRKSVTGIMEIFYFLFNPSLGSQLKLSPCCATVWPWGRYMTFLISNYLACEIRLMLCNSQVIYLKHLAQNGACSRHWRNSGHHQIKHISRFDLKFISTLDDFTIINLQQNVSSFHASPP